MEREYKKCKGSFERTKWKEEAVPDGIRGLYQHPCLRLIPFPGDGKRGLRKALRSLRRGAGRVFTAITVLVLIKLPGKAEGVLWPWEARPPPPPASPPRLVDLPLGVRPESQGRVHHALIIRSRAAPSVSSLCSSSRELGRGSDFIRLRDEHPQTDRGLRDRMCHFGHLGPRSFPRIPAGIGDREGSERHFFSSCPIFKALT